MVLADIRREGKGDDLPSSGLKEPVTIEYDDNRRPVRIDTIVVSTQHDEFIQPEMTQKKLNWRLMKMLALRFART